MKRIIASLFLVSMLGCTQYRGPAGDYNTFGRSTMMECQEIVYPDGIGPGKEAIGFGCKEYTSSGISGEAAGILEAFINQIPGLPVFIKWVNGGAK